MISKQLVFAVTRETLPLLTALLCLSSGLAAAQTYEVPRRGQWVTGPHMSRRDLSDDAITSGAFSFGAANSIATVYVACKGVDSGAPVLELRASVPAFPGSAASSHGAEITVGDFVKSVALEVIPLSSQVIFVAELDRRQIAALAKDNSDDLGGLSIGFTAGARNGLISADLPSRNHALDVVLSSCRASNLTKSDLAVRPSFNAEAGTARPRTLQGHNSWRLNEVDGGTEFLLPGTVEANGQRRGAVLQFSCKVKQFADSKLTYADMTAELRVPLAIVNFDYSDITMEGGGADFGRSQIGVEPEIHIGMSADEVPDKTPGTNQNAIAPFKLTYSEPDLKQIIESPGKSLKLVIHPPSTGNDDAVAFFQLPADAITLQSTMSPCFEKIENEERRAHAQDLISCPVLAGKTLVKADVLVGSAGKPLPWTEDSETPDWTLPNVSKAHPLRPKLDLACYYGPDGYVERAKYTPEKHLLAIPAAAKYCSYRALPTEGRSHAECAPSVREAY